MTERRMDYESLLIAADRMAGAIQRCVKAGLISSRNPAADAMLDYGNERHGPDHPIQDVEQRDQELIVNRFCYLPSAAERSATQEDK